LQEKERLNEAQQEFIRMEDTLLKKCHKLRESLGDKETQFLDWGGGRPCRNSRSKWGLLTICQPSKEQLSLKI